MRFAEIAAALPGCLFAVGSAVALLLAANGRDPIWPYEPVNLSEAAGMDDEAEVARLIGLGEDPNAPRDTRPGFVLNVPGHLTPLEAAVTSGNPSMVSTLLVNGAALNAGTWNRLRCLADDRKSDLTAMLEAHRPHDAMTHCDRSARER
jgi:hypothetical protein